MTHASRAALALASALVTSMAVATDARAEGEWWPITVYDASSGENVEVDYVPLEQAAEPWNICVLFPHMKDSFWVAVAYGIVEEATRQNRRDAIPRLKGNLALYENGKPCRTPW